MQWKIIKKIITIPIFLKKLKIKTIKLKSYHVVNRTHDYTEQREWGGPDWIQFISPGLQLKLVLSFRFATLHIKLGFRSKIKSSISSHKSQNELKIKSFQFCDLV